MVSVEKKLETHLVKVRCFIDPPVPHFLIRFVANLTSPFAPDKHNSCDFAETWLAYIIIKCD